MIKKTLFQSARAFALLIFTAMTITVSTPAYPSWNNDIDGRAAPWVGYGGSLYYVAYYGNYQYVMRWSPNIAEDEQILAGNYEASFFYLTVHDGFLYAAGTISNVSSPVSSGIDVHGIAKVDLSTLVVTDPFSMTANPIPYSMVWDHNGTPYIGGISWTGSGNHYEMNVFKKWSGSNWVTVGGGLIRNGG